MKFIETFREGEMISVFICAKINRRLRQRLERAIIP